MSLQDDIFDIQDALKNKKGLLDAFDKFCDYLYQLEETVENQQKTLNDIRKGALALKGIFNE